MSDHASLTKVQSNYRKAVINNSTGSLTRSVKSLAIEGAILVSTLVIIILLWAALGPK